MPLLLLIQSSETQDISIDNLQHNPGLLPFKLGPARVEITKHSEILQEIKTIDRQFAFTQKIILTKYASFTKNLIQ